MNNMTPMKQMEHETATRLAPKKQEEKKSTSGKVSHKPQSKSDTEVKRSQDKHEHQIRSNLINCRKNQVKEDIPDFPKGTQKLWGQDTKHKSTMWKSKTVRQESNNNTKTGLVSSVNQRKMEHTKP